MAANGQMESEWIRLLDIWLGYSFILVPIAAIVIYGKWAHKQGKLGQGSIRKFVKSFAIGHPRQTIPSNYEENDKSNSFKTDCIWIIFYSFGLISSLFIMGLVQERIITQSYPHTDNTHGADKFGDMQFLVFCNRLIALLMASCGYFYYRKRQPIHVPPYYFHCYTSIANIVSSWFQYTALKYASFPIVTISKSGKTAAVMFMDRLLRGNRYSWIEYGTAGGITIGGSLFIINSSRPREYISSTTVTGILLIFGYLISDSFTNTFQKALFEAPKISRIQMMFGVNFFSVILSFISLMRHSGILTNIDFALHHEYFLQHILWMSMASAISQIFIYGMIDHYGATTLSIVLTFRQLGSILISVLFYGHPSPPLAIFGLGVAFSSTFLLIYYRYSKRAHKIIR